MPQTGKRIATTKLSSNRTTTVPEPVRKAEGLDAGDKVDWRLVDDEWVLRPARDEPCVSLSVLTELVGEPCRECEAGTLERDEIDGHPAVVCTDCETTRATLWSDN